MKNNDVKRLIIAELEANGLDFEKSAFELSGGERETLRKYASQVGYKRSKTAYLSTGAAFFEHLKKLRK